MTPAEIEKEAERLLEDYGMKWSKESVKIRLISGLRAVHDCYCHNPAKIRFFEGQLKVADALAKAMRKAKDEGRETTVAIEEALAAYEKARNA